MNRRGFFGCLVAAMAGALVVVVKPRRRIYIKSRLYKADIPRQMEAYDEGLKRYLATQGGDWRALPASADSFWSGRYPGYIFEPNPG